MKLYGNEQGRTNYTRALIEASQQDLSAGNEAIDGPPRTQTPLSEADRKVRRPQIINHQPTQEVNGYVSTEPSNNNSALH